MDLPSAFARERHAGQTRRGGRTPYAVHPERVGQLLREAGVEGPDVLAAAVLQEAHEVLRERAPRGRRR